ncbi:MAG TPA: SDR family oxidoreductase [Candidatus Limnocylindria bacterium]|jgi:NAD(P)-dependent dehydrogenase (short-subunit alcohol dehydrogenase family)|nr:SDR family oxidoreductase [Candidatus Limnocylindria bacterium]
MKDKIILITGGTSGIGLATAQLLGAEGARIIVTGRNPETLAAARKELPEGTVIIKSDSASLVDAQALGNEVRKYTDRLDGAFLNAGIAQFSPLESATAQNYDDLFNVNVRGPFFQLQSLLPLLGNPSAVVFTSSVVSEMAWPTLALYAATKASVVSFGKSLAVELAPRGIRVNVLSPGPVATPIVAKLGVPEESQKQFAEKSLVKRWGRPEELAKVARFLLSEDSSFVIGENVVADGGVRLT